jgi:hypothetical protein
MTKFYPNIWQLIPYSLQMNQWDQEGAPIVDLILNNWYASHNKVAEMNLNIRAFTALDSEGIEHYITDFRGTGIIPVKGLHKGEFLRSRSILSLGPGSYTALRFYLAESGNSFIFNDGRKELVTQFQYLDFEIENGLEIRGDEAPEVILRFCLEPFSTWRHFRHLGEWVKKSRGFGTKLANGLAGAAN